MTTPEQFKNLDSRIRDQNQPHSTEEKSSIKTKGYRDPHTGQFIVQEANQTGLQGNTFVNQEIVSPIVDAKGRYQYKSPFRESWTGIPIYDESDLGFCACCSHESDRDRTVFIGGDGIVTNRGNVICTECAAMLEKRNLMIIGSLGLLNLVFPKY